MKPTATRKITVLVGGACLIAAATAQPQSRSDQNNHRRTRRPLTQRGRRMRRR